MRIALVSYEYPPDTATGGIAIYTRQWARLLLLRGHYVEVFCASYSRTESVVEDGFLVHRIQESDRMLFKKTILPIFCERHQIKNFDVIESPEFNADGKLIRQSYPEIKLVVKLHSPTFLIDEFNEVNANVSFWAKQRFIAGAYMRFQKPSKYWKKIVIFIWRRGFLLLMQTLSLLLQKVCELLLQVSGSCHFRKLCICPIRICLILLTCQYLLNL